MTYEEKELGWMVHQFESNTGRPPKTIEEITDHWYEIGNHVVVKEHVDEDGRYHPAETVAEVDAIDHCRECIFLRDLEQRPDAAAMLAAALAVPREPSEF